MATWSTSAATLPACHCSGSATQTDRGRPAWPAEAARVPRTDRYRASDRDRRAPAAVTRDAASVAESEAAVARRRRARVAEAAAPHRAGGRHAEQAVQGPPQVVHGLRPLGEHGRQLGPGGARGGGAGGHGGLLGLGRRLLHRPVELRPEVLADQRGQVGHEGPHGPRRRVGLRGQDGALGGEGPVRVGVVGTRLARHLGETTDEQRGDDHHHDEKDDPPGRPATARPALPAWRHVPGKLVRPPPPGTAPVAGAGPGAPVRVPVAPAPAVRRPGRPPWCSRPPWPGCWRSSATAPWGRWHGRRPGRDGAPPARASRR